MAKEEGAVYRFLTQPVRFIAGKNGRLAAIECIQMVLGEPDKKGRRRPVPVENSSFMVECDTAVLALGYWPDPIIGNTTPDIETHDWGLISADKATGKTSRPYFRAETVSQVLIWSSPPWSLAGMLPGRSMPTWKISRRIKAG